MKDPKQQNVLKNDGFLNILLMVHVTTSTELAASSGSTLVLKIIENFYKILSKICEEEEVGFPATCGIDF